MQSINKRLWLWFDAPLRTSLHYLKVSFITYSHFIFRNISKHLLTKRNQWGSKNQLFYQEKVYKMLIWIYLHSTRAPVKRWWGPRHTAITVGLNVNLQSYTKNPVITVHTQKNHDIVYCYHISKPVRVEQVIITRIKSLSSKLNWAETADTLVLAHFLSKE